MIRVTFSLAERSTSDQKEGLHIGGCYANLWCRSYGVCVNHIRRRSGKQMIAARLACELLLVRRGGLAIALRG
jgi:hypothetical protein